MIHGLKVFEIDRAGSHIENLDLMTDRQTLTELSGRLMGSVGGYLERKEPDYILVHGDTLTTFCVAWAAFLKGLPAGHVEAGLRSGSLMRSGILRLVGSDPDELKAIATELLEDAPQREAMARSPNPYGDGEASGRVARFVELRLGLGPRPDELNGPTSG